MCNICIALIILLSLMCYSSALVHYVKLPKGVNGCNYNGKELEVGETVKDPKTCGIYVCQNKDGDSLIHYCQRTAAFEACPNEGVSTTIDFPQCCWTCVILTKC